MFLGEHQHTLDAKGRVSLPAKFRQQMPGSVVLVNGFEKCLYVFPAEEYQRFVAGLMKQDDFNPNLRKLRRFFTAGAVEIELDSAGRVSIPAVLRDYAGLSKDVTVNGNGTRIELWDSAKWAAYDAETSENIEELAQGLSLDVQL